MSAEMLDRLQRELAPVSEQLVDAVGEGLSAMRDELAKAQQLEQSEYTRGYRKAMREALKLLEPAERAHDAWLAWAWKAAQQLSIDVNGSLDRHLRAGDVAQQPVGGSAAASAG